MHGHTHGTSGDPDNLYLPRLAEIKAIHQETPTERTFSLALLDDEPFDYLPGQFALVSVFGAGEIPLGLASSASRPGLLQITCRRYPLGLVTCALHKLEVGDQIGLRGPMGNAFPLHDVPGADLVLVAGGIGLPTLRAALMYALDNRADFGKLFLLYGAVAPDARLYVDDLNEWTRSEEVTCLQAVDRADGVDWPHHEGFVTDLVAQCDLNPDRSLALMCGPPAMVGPVAGLLMEKGMSDERIMVNMEANMQCGVGKCGHCALGDKYVCTDGPVFTWREVQTLREP